MWERLPIPAYIPAGWQDATHTECWQRLCLL